MRHAEQVQVGLPARGKSYLANKLMRYMRASVEKTMFVVVLLSDIPQWLEFNVQVFNVGQLRRSKARTLKETEGKKADHSAQFFSDSNPDAKASREMLAEESLEALISWLKAEGNVGIMGRW